MRDPYQTFRATAQELETEGVERGTIIDAMLCTGLNAANRLTGPEQVISFLHRMISEFESGAEQQAPPRMTQ